MGWGAKELFCPRVTERLTSRLFPFVSVSKDRKSGKLARLSSGESNCGFMAMPRARPKNINIEFMVRELTPWTWLIYPKAVPNRKKIILFEQRKINISENVRKLIQKWEE